MINQMDNISFELCDILCCEGYKAISIPNFFPIKIHDGKLKGYLSLKHCAVGAGMGSIGLNNLLISEKYGNRLCLSALLTEEEIDYPIKKIHRNLCFNCNKCRDICPTNAIDKNGVKVTKCINFTYSIPKLARPVVQHMMGLRLTEKYLEIFVNIMGWNSEMVCSECLTVCSYYQTYNDRII